MEDIVSQLMTTSTVVFVLAVITVMAIIRRIVETLVPSWVMKAGENDKEASYATRGAELWNKLGLYLLPPLIGLALSFIEADLLLSPELQPMSARMLYGLVIGYFSRDVFKTFRQVIKRDYNVEVSAS